MRRTAAPREAAPEPSGDDGVDGSSTRWVGRTRTELRQPRAFGGGTAIVGVIYSAIPTLFSAVSTVTWGLVQLQLPALGSFRPLALAVGLESA
jgi:hypothetical protein